MGKLLKFVGGFFLFMIAFSLVMNLLVLPHTGTPKPDPSAGPSRPGDSLIQLAPFLILIGLWAAVVFPGSAKRAERAKQTAQTVLMPGEQLVGEALQHRAYALLHRRVVLIITSSRVLTLQRRLLGGFKMTDIQWKDLLDATIEQNMLGGLLGSNLKFRHSNGGPGAITVDGVPNQVATAIYSRAQLEEQAWEEKRRVRVMEEARAISGGVTVHAAAPSTAAPSSNRVLDEIQKAKALLDAGAVSDAEFQEMKAKILAG